MIIAGAVCGAVMGFLIGFGGRVISDVFEISRPSVFMGTAIVLLLMAGPWVTWHVRGSRARLALVIDADDLAMPWYGGGIFMVLVGLGTLLVCEFLSPRARYGDDSSLRWMGIQILASLGLMVLGAVIDVVRRRRAFDSAMLVGIGGVAPANMAEVDAVQRRAFVRRGTKLIGMGIGILVLGVLASIVASALLSVLGMAVVGTGALAVGLVTLLRGLYFIFLR